MNISSGIIKKVVSYVNVLAFLSELMEEKSDNAEWIEALDSTKNFIAENEIFYIFLKHLYSELMSYKVQTSHGKFSFTDIQDGNYFGKIKQLQLSLPLQDQVENFKLSDFQLKALNHVMNSTLNAKINMEISNSIGVIIKGNFIKFSDFLDEKGEISDNYLSDNSFTIFALDTIFIDRDLNVAGLNLSIIAPKWIISCDRIINLDGAPGKSHDKSQADDGCDGLPGLPGRSAGNFFAVGKTFDCIEKLNVTANGGMGGPGQKGGKGRDGKDGNDGERGGNGGAGGVGGSKGVVKIIALQQKTQLSNMEQSSDGAEGLHREGGEGGEAGENEIKDDAGNLGNLEDLGKIITPVALKSPAAATVLGVFALFAKGYSSTISKLTQKDKGKPGPKGDSGKNTEGRLLSKKKDFQNTTSTMQVYKKYLNENINDPYKHNLLEDFLNELEHQIV